MTPPFPSKEEESKFPVNISPPAFKSMTPPFPSKEEESKFPVNISPPAFKSMTPPFPSKEEESKFPRVKLVPEISISRPLVLIVSEALSWITKSPKPSPSASAIKEINPAPGAKFNSSSAKSSRVILLVACKTIFVSPDKASNSDS